MIDIHCHILPNIDDGSKTVAESLAMGQEAERQGIRTILCTPHHVNGIYSNKAEGVISSVNDLQIAFNEKKININLLPAQEIHLTENLIQQIADKEIIFWGGKNNLEYILIEFPTMSIPVFSKDFFYRLKALNKTPIIVHPERNQVFYKDLDKLREFVEIGALVQVTAGSIVGDFGKGVQQIVNEMFRQSLVHIVATDAHGIKTRRVRLKLAYDTVASEFGESAVAALKKNSENLFVEKKIGAIQIKKKKNLLQKIFGIKK